MSDVVVRLTAAQHRELVTLAEMCARPRTARALAVAVPVLTEAQHDALTAAEALQDCEWDDPWGADNAQRGKRRALAAATQRVRKAMAPRR